MTKDLSAVETEKVRIERARSTTGLDVEAISCGNVFTPVRDAERLMEAIVEQILAKRGRGQKLHFLEPSSGDGNLVLALINVLQRLEISKESIQIDSFEVNAEFMRQQRRRVSREVGGWVKRVSFTNGDFLFGNRNDTKYDAVLMNPPWIGYRGIPPKLREMIRMDFGIKGQFDLLDPFVLRAFELTKIDGRLLLFLPDKVLSSHQSCNSVARIALHSRMKKVPLSLDFFPGVQHESVFLEVVKRQEVSKIISPGVDPIRCPKDSIRLGDLFAVFRGMEISGRSCPFITNKKSEAIDSERIFVTGQDILTGSMDCNSPPKYLSREFPRAKLKTHFEYQGPAILVRKTGTPVNVSYVESLPHTSQVVFVLVPKPELLRSKSEIKKIADFLNSPEGQSQLARNSGKLERAVFPYVTLSDLKAVTVNLKRLSPALAHKLAA